MHDVTIDKKPIETVDPSCLAFNRSRPHTAILLILDIGAYVFSANCIDMLPAVGFKENEKGE
jgi:hypothetical protein